LKLLYRGVHGSGSHFGAACAQSFFQSPLARVTRSYFYAPHLHGFDTVADEKKCEPNLQNLASCDDLKYIFQEMLAEITSQVRVRAPGLVWIHPDASRFSACEPAGTCRRRSFLRKKSRMSFTRKWNLKKTAEQSRLPREVNGRWEFPNCVYRNQHKDSAYRLLPVDSGYKITALDTS